MPRSHFSFALLALAGLAMLSAAVPALAQQSRVVNEPPTLILGTVASDPGTTATIPVYYRPGDARSVRTVHLEVEFVSNSVAFTKAEKGVAAETQNFELAVKADALPPQENLQRTRLSIDVSVAEPGKALPEGLWTLLDFQVPADAKAFAIALNPVAVTAQDADKKPVKLLAEAGKIIVSVPDEPLGGCFFFTH